VSDWSPDDLLDHPIAGSVGGGAFPTSKRGPSRRPEPSGPPVRGQGQRRVSAEHPEDTLETLRRENLRLRREIGALAREAEKNESIFRRFQALELSLLTAASLLELVDRLVQGTRQTLGLDEVTLLLHDPRHEVRNLLAGDALPFPVLPGVRLTEDLSLWRRVCGERGGPWLGSFRKNHSVLFSGTRAFGSVALLPLATQECVFGGLSLASVDPNRYTRNHACDFHNRLAGIASLCLQNAMNRERLIVNSHTDLLTHWYNRRYLDIRLPQEVARALRYREPLCCLMLDLDHFKRINDRYGHPAGDAVLREVADRIKKQLRSSDLRVRYGGEEFVVFLIRTREEDAASVAERVRRGVAEAPIRLQGEASLRVTLSGGIAELAPGDRSKDPVALGAAMLQRADAALYRAKAAGRDRIVCHGKGEI